MTMLKLSRKTLLALEAVIDGRTALVIVHGMAGSSASGPAVDLAWSALRRGLSVVRMNMRTCGGTEACTPGLYHANLPGDVLAVVRHLVDRQRVDRRGLAYGCGYGCRVRSHSNFLDARV